MGELEKYRPSMESEVLHAWAAAAQKEIESLRTKLAEAYKENEEQARLLGMSAEREARLAATLAECERMCKTLAGVAEYNLTRVEGLMVIIHEAYNLIGEYRNGKARAVLYAALEDK